MASERTGAGLFLLTAADSLSMPAGGGATRRPDGGYFAERCRLARENLRLNDLPADRVEWEGDVFKSIAKLRDRGEVSI